MAGKKKSTIIEYRNYFLPPEFPVLLLSGDHWKISDIPSGRLHFHNCLEIGFCHSESGIMEFFGNEYHFKAGDLTFIPKNIPHTTYSDKGCESRWSYLFLEPSEIFEGILPPSVADFEFSFNPENGYTPIISAEAYPGINQLVIAIIRELEEKKAGYQTISKCLLATLCLVLLRLQDDLRKKNDSVSGAKAEDYLIIQPVLKFIEKNYAENFSTDSLADLCHLSPTHFRRIFLRIMGTNPLDYLNSVRIFRACDLLRSTEDSVLSISETVGFKSIATFNRRFSELMRMTPRDYRTHMRQSEKSNEKQTILEFTGWLLPE
ncbi:MAG: AraC family transcriptional regulator [Lachnospiraceae bacterium]|nr:AraC family transcriptional regulator [Lachnospiraceae bacterium]